MRQVRVLLSALLALGLVVLGGFVAVSASAHTPDVTASCDALQVNLVKYNTGGTNTVVVTIDDKVVEDNTPFGASFSKSYDAPDKYTSYSYEVQVTAHDDPDGTRGWSKTFTGKSTACEDEQPPAPTCVDTIKDKDVSAAYTDPFHAVVTYTGPKPLCEDVSKTVSLNSYQTEGPTWPKSGTQKFVDHDAVTIDSEHSSGKLSVKEPSCYYQTDLYWGGKRYDGVDGAVPHYNDSRIAGLIDYRNGGDGCKPPVNPSGTFTVQCDDDGAVVTLGTLSKEAGVTWRLKVNGTPQDVKSGDVVQVPAEADLVLVWRLDGDTHVEKTAKAPKACPPAVVTPPSGTLATSCTATGASVDIGTLSEGSSTGGSFALVVNGTPQTVTSGATGIAVPGGAGLVLRYQPATGPNVQLASATAPAACPAVVPPTRDLSVTKTVTPTGPAKFGDVLTYGLTVSASGNAGQTGVTVTDAVPAGTSYKVGSAACPGGCASVTVANGTVTWVIGSMAAGTTRSVSFQVVIDTPKADANGGIPAVTIVNSGAVASAEVPVRPSNEVETPVAAVEGVKTGNPPPPGGEEPDQGSQLPHTGASSVWRVMSAAVLLVVLGGGLLIVEAARPVPARRRRFATGS